MGEQALHGKADGLKFSSIPKDITGPYSMLKMFIHPATLKLEAIQSETQGGNPYTMILTSD